MIASALFPLAVPFRLPTALARPAGRSGGHAGESRILRQGRDHQEIALHRQGRHGECFFSVLVRKVDVPGFPRLNDVVASSLIRVRSPWGQAFRFLPLFQRFLVPFMLRRAVATAGQALPRSAMASSDITASSTAIPGVPALDSPSLDFVDKRLLDIIQSGFPLAPRPYALLGEELGISEREALDRVRALKRGKIIRRLGANFQSAKLGFRSTLCGAKVPEEKLGAFIAEVNALPGVTHNYLRDHVYNVWFTLIGPSWEELCAVLDGVVARTGIPVLNLPATRLYKIRVDFQHSEDD